MVSKQSGSFNYMIAMLNWVETANDYDFAWAVCCFSKAGCSPPMVPKGDQVLQFTMIQNDQALRSKLPGSEYDLYRSSYIATVRVWYCTV